MKIAMLLLYGGLKLIEGSLLATVLAYVGYGKDAIIPFPKMRASVIPSIPITKAIKEMHFFINQWSVTDFES